MINSIFNEGAQCRNMSEYVGIRRNMWNEMERVNKACRNTSENVRIFQKVSSMFRFEK